jgi:hypothetical protein
VKAIIDRTDDVRLQVDYGKDETVLVYLWQVAGEAGLERTCPVSPTRHFLTPVENWLIVARTDD